MRERDTETETETERERDQKRSCEMVYDGFKKEAADLSLWSPERGSITLKLRTLGYNVRLHHCRP